jgi:uncharacterized protein YgbK (DUF1537 family)
MTVILTDAESVSGGSMPAPISAVVRDCRARGVDPAEAERLVSEACIKWAKGNGS